MFVTIIAAAAIAVTAVPAGAQNKAFPGMTLKFAESDAARDMFNTGLDSFEAGKYAQAESQFREVLRKWPKNPIADRTAYYLIRTLGEQKKMADAKAQIAAFQQTYRNSSWMKDVLEYQAELTNQINPSTAMDLADMASVKAAMDSARAALVEAGQAIPPAPPAPPARPARVAPMAGMRRGIAGPFGGRQADENPELTLQRQALRVLFETNPDRAIEICGERLKSDPKDELVLSSLDMFASSKSDKALPMLISIAKTTTDPKGRRDAVYWISRSRGDKDAITDTLTSFVPTMTNDEDSNAVLYALSQVNTPKGFDALAGMARDKNRPQNVRIMATQRLGESRLPNRWSLLNDIYKSASDNTAVRRQAVMEIGRVGRTEPEVIGVLSGIAANDPEISVRTSAVTYIGQIKTPEAQKALEDLILKKKP